MKELFKKNPPRMIFYSGLVLVIILTIVGVAAGFLIKSTNADPNTLVTVGSKKITRTDLDNALKSMSTEYQSFSAEDKKGVLKNLVDTEIIKQEAKKLSLVISDEDLYNYEKSQGETYTKEEFDKLPTIQKNSLKERGEVEIYKSKLRDQFVGYKTGNVAIARFDKYIELGGATEANKAQLTAEEKTYAKGKIDAYLAEVTAGTKTMGEVMALLDSDPRIGKPGWNNTTSYDFSFELTKYQYENKDNHSQSEDLWKAIKNQANGLGQVGEFTVKSTDENNKDALGSFYAFAKIDDVKDGALTWDDWMTQKYNDYNINLESVSL